MTEKELKKLSRLELLELLLEVSTENHTLKERIKKLNAEIETAQHIEQLSSAITQMENMMKNVSRLSAAEPSPATAVPSVTEVPKATLMDKQIYRWLLGIYSKNETLLSTLPLELQIAIKERISSILN